MANSADSDQTTPLAIWFESTLFAQTCLSNNLGSLWYMFYSILSIRLAIGMLIIVCYYVNDVILTSLSVMFWLGLDVFGEKGRNTFVHCTFCNIKTVLGKHSSLYFVKKVICQNVVCQNALCKHLSDSNESMIKNSVYMSLGHKQFFGLKSK